MRITSSAKAFFLSCRYSQRKVLAEEMVLRSLRALPFFETFSDPVRVTGREKRVLKSLCQFEMHAKVKDSLIVQSLAFVNSCIQKVSLFIRYFSRNFNCRVMPVSSQFSTMRKLISSMYLLRSRGLVLLRFSISVSTANIKILPKATAIFVPIVVPCVWR